jgi:site-specific DNA-methyltransferase (cytosine-N4-specific)
MALAKQLNTYDQEFWDFKKYKEKNIPFKYPAMMVAPMQQSLLNEIVNDDPSINNILDPFVGSGTVLEAGREFNLDLYGIDINPLAILLTQVRVLGIDNSIIYKSFNRLKVNIILLRGNIEPFHFDKISKWFREDIVYELSIIKKAIQLEKVQRIREFYWICFSDVVRKYSNSRSTTFKLHSKTQDSIEKMDNDCIEYFLDRTLNYIPKLCKNPYSKKINLKCGDSINELSSMKDDSVDLLYTSPPYGDNQTTVTYGQFSVLPLNWIDPVDLNLRNRHFINKVSEIDNSSLGGMHRNMEVNELYKDLLHNISPSKQKKVISFFNDYSVVFAEMVRILKPGKRLVLTLGNRRVDNNIIDFDVYNDRIAQFHGLVLETELSRNIQWKRTPSRVSHVKNFGSVESMKKEYIKVYKK